MIKNGFLFKNSLFQSLQKRFTQESKKQKKQFILSVALTPIVYIVSQSYNIKQINGNVDFVNLMTYDYHTPNTIPYTNFNAPLYSNEIDILYFKYFNVNFSVDYMHKLGMDKNKIVVGIPFYGYLYYLANTKYHEVYSLYNGTQGKHCFI